jgi:hypothetical protein
MLLPEHSVAAPSKAARFVQCPGSIPAEVAFPELPNADPDAPDGVAAHWAGAEYLGDGVIHKGGDIAPNGVVLTDEMLDAAQVWIDDVLQVCKETATDPKHLMVERRIRAPYIHAVHGYGTLDTALWTPGIHVYHWDFKYGHRFVPAYENWQLIYYANGLLAEKPDIPWERVTFHFRIVQPRCFSREEMVREWVVNADDLRAHFNLLKSAVDEGLGPDPRYRPGEECRDCSARTACKALHATTGAIMDHVTREQPMALPPEALAWELRAAKRALGMLKGYVDGLEEQARYKLLSGERLPGLGMVSGRGKTIWSVPEAQAIMMARMVGVDIAKPPEALTPLQAEKKGLNPAVIGGLVKRIPGKATVEIDDGSLARRVGFGK